MKTKELSGHIEEIEWNMKVFMQTFLTQILE